MKNDHSRNSGLDLLRAIAILAVLFLHQCDAIKATPAWLASLAHFGWSGVDIFFVLSGFLIAGQVVDTNGSTSYTQSLKQFWIKRWFRTLPLYFVVLFFYLVIKPYVLGYPFQGQAWPFFFFWQNFNSPQDFVQSWSLCIEEHFYLIFPLLVFLRPERFKKWPWLFLLPIFFSMLMRWYIVQNNTIEGEPELSNLIRFPTFTNLDGISFGVFLAYSKKVWAPKTASFSLVIFLLGLVSFLTSLKLSGPQPLGAMTILSPALLSLSAGIMLMGAYHLTTPKLITPVIYWISITSYGMYLWNNIFIRVGQKYWHELPWAVGAVLFYSGTFLIALASYKVIEKPCMKMRQRLL